MGARIIIMAGGTGGHVFPALAVGQYLQAQDWQVSWIGTKKGMESKVVSAQGIEIDWLTVQGIRGKGLIAKVNSVLSLLKSLWQAYKILRKRQPDVVLGMGGFVAGPGGLMASLMGIPLVIHEQNRVPGTTNRLLAKRADKILEAFPGSFKADANAIYTGNPLRSDFLNLAKKEYWNEESKRNLRILIVGGSQGAKALNDMVPLAVENLDKTEIRHQTGKNAYDQVVKRYAEFACKVEITEFIEDIAGAYQWADMVICRAGAMTVSEIAAVGLPAILIPLPQAIDDHQTANARYLADAEAGIVLMQNDLNEMTLLTAINEVKRSLMEKSSAAKKKSKLEATELVASICIELAA